MAPSLESGSSPQGRSPLAPPSPSVGGGPNHSAVPGPQEPSPTGCPPRFLGEISVETAKTREEEILPRKDGRMSPSEPRFAAAFHNDSGPSLESDESAVDESLFDFLDSEPEVVAFFRLLLLEGRKRPGDSGVPFDSKPSWVDDDKIRLGQQFAQKYFFGVMLAEMASLFLLFTAPGSLKPLLFSGNSHTPLKAFHRYLSTVDRVRSWYSGDLWAAEGEARRNLEYVRKTHDRYRRRLSALNSAPPEKQARCTALQGAPWEEGAADAVRRDFAARGAAAGNGICPIFNLITSRHEWVNQMEMSITQFGFVALAVTYPELFATNGASEEEMDGFVHLWEVLGHLLGVEERFNFCAGGLRAVRKRSKTLVRGFYSPAMAHIDASWEHMSRCMVGGLRFYSPHLTYEVVLVHTLRVFEAEPPRHLLQKLNAHQRLQSRLMAWVLRWVSRVAPLRELINWSLRSRIELAHKHANDAQWLRERDARVGFASARRRHEEGNKQTTLRSLFEVCLRLAAPISALALVIVTAVMTHHDLALYRSSVGTEMICQNV